MSKINNKILLIVFVVLAAAYFGNKYLGNSGERNFREKLIEIDTSAVDKIVITPPISKHIVLTLTKAGSTWDVTNDTIKDDAEMSMVRSMLSTLVSLKPKRLVASSEDKWKEYQVSDSLSTRVKAYSGDKLLADLIVGKFDFNQQSRTMATFVRRADEKQVYSVDGFITSTFTADFNTLRNKTFLHFNKDDLTSIKFDYPADSSFSLSKLNSKWQVVNEPADSAAVAKYLNSASTFNMREFVDNYQPAGSPMYTMTVDGDNMSTVTIQCYKEGDDYILHSSLNDNAWFRKGNINIFERLLVPRSKFLTKGK